ncbi:ectoine/hydroxyectoine ABC transporter permease subunit EhuC [Rhizobium sp.]
MANVSEIYGYGWFILTGIGATLNLTFFSCVLALVAAFVSGLALLSPRAWIHVPARVYVEVFRGTSVFVQLFVAYFVLPLTGLELTPTQAAILAFGLNTGAYGAEVVRSAVGAIGRDQREATIALNLTRYQSMRWVILPQAILIMLPSFGNLAIETMKSTSIASLITVSELTFQAQTVRTQTGETAMPFLLIMVTYLIVASFITTIVSLLERRLGRGILNTGT